MSRFDVAAPVAKIGLRGLSARDRGMFWEGFVATRPGIGYVRGNGFSRWRAVPGVGLNIALYITNRSVGLFVRGQRGTPLSATRIALRPDAERLERALGARLDDEAPLLRNLRLPTTDTTCWPIAYDWLRDNEADYLKALAASGASSLD